MKISPPLFCPWKEACLLMTGYMVICLLTHYLAAAPVWNEWAPGMEKPNLIWWGAWLCIFKIQSPGAGAHVQ